MVVLLWGKATAVLVEEATFQRIAVRETTELSLWTLMVARALAAEGMAWLPPLYRPATRSV
jgi:hypothetical protein